MIRLFTKKRQSELRRLLFSTSPYGWVLKRRTTRIPTAIKPAFTGDAKRGQSIQISDLMDTIQADQSHPSDTRGSMDRFLWLVDLQASGLDAIARDITAEWIEHHQQWEAESWQLNVLADRLSTWICASSFLQAGADDQFIADFSTAASQQAEHLKFATGIGEPIEFGFGVSKAMIFCGISMPSRLAWLSRGLLMLEHAIDDEILSDGGHISRNPETHLNALARLIDIRAALQSRTLAPPTWLQAAIDKMTPMLRSFLLGDGRLVTFNGAQLSDAATINAVLKASGATGRAITNSPHSGFQRLSAGRTIVVIDTGQLVNTVQLINENAGTLAFELSVGKQRIVVNCGQPPSGHKPLITALRGTRAHSTLSVGEINSSEINEAGCLGPRRAWRTQSLRREIEKNTLVEASHEGYRDVFGLTHKRALFLSPGGNELRGEDSLRGPQAEDVTIRFHLHPSVQASLVEAGNSVLLKFGKSAGWRFRASITDIKLDDSLYYDHTTRRQSQQIVLKVGHKDPETIIKWRFAQED